jgi:hypothetical protein
MVAVIRLTIKLTGAPEDGLNNSTLRARSGNSYAFPSCGGIPLNLQGVFS